MLWTLVFLEPGGRGWRLEPASTAGQGGRMGERKGTGRAGAQAGGVNYVKPNRKLSGCEWLDVELCGRSPWSEARGRAVDVIPGASVT